MLLDLIETTAPNINVCIIGAGIAGLRAACHLEKCSIPYTIFEGSSRIGGRIFPFKYDNGFLQHGAEYVNGFENEIYDIVLKRHLLDPVKSRTQDLFIVDETTVTIVNGKKVNHKIIEIWNEFVESLTNILEEESWNIEPSPTSIEKRLIFHFGNFLKIVPIRDIGVYTSLFELFTNYFQIEWSSPISELCLANLSKWDDGTDIEDSAVLDKFGFSKILCEFESQVPKENIRLNSKVINLNYEGEKVRIRLENGGDFYFDHVIVTSSLGYLKNHHRKLFSPSLDQQKQIAIRDMGFGNNMKIFIEFESSWWSDESTIMIKNHQNSDKIISQKLANRLMVFQPSNWATNILVAWIADDGPFEASILSDNELINLIQTHLNDNLKNDYNLSKIKKIYRHHWSEDQFACGSYSYLTPESIIKHSDIISELSRPIIFNNKPIICFAGEHTSQLMYQTTVGASQSGLREAKRITNCYTKTTVEL